MKLYEETNNLANIRYNKNNNWKGQVEPIRGFCAFTSVSYGVRAAFRLLLTYLRTGTNTIEKIVTRWAPPSENDTSRYVSFVENDTMIDRDRELDMTTIAGYWELIIVLRAIILQESGVNLDEQQINLYINYPERFS